MTPYKKGKTDHTISILLEVPWGSLPVSSSKISIVACPLSAATIASAYVTKEVFGTGKATEALDSFKICSFARENST
eukprot:CAMPEP_0204613510 /NCGR_PEP_ID=MMETSP0717-20131115/1462_1 /ASSEMBLY_ACC=CAM_ASM_000666 /TAXON_ID=230516 /ORGANISM="Chaetoceros curvisetus" /LENGTH=76 /DNA_ID=CAMNT_0051625949 /DNA_START=15 /DNA_END=245 /DNA_ORIENTATION=-